MTGVVWTAEEDEQLKSLVEEFGTKKWALIATKMPGKSKGSKQCRRRWKNFLNMNAKTCSWSPEEDEQLINLHRIHGNRWTSISEVFGDRTDNAVKNRWAALVRKHPHLGDEEGSQGGLYDQAPPSAKRQRVGEGQPTGAFQPYIASQGQYAPSLLGHFNGLPVTSMPTPFDQQLLMNPQQQQLMSAAQHAQQQQQQAQQAQQQEGQPPLSIVVNKNVLNPFEMTLVQQINQAHAPVHIEVQERPVQGPELTADLVTKRSSWRQFVESLDEPTSHISDILAWFNNASVAGQLQTSTTGRRLTRSLSKTGAPGGGAVEGLTDDHKNLLVRLMSKGLEYRTTSEQAELDMLGLAAVAALGEGAHAGEAGGAAAAENKGVPRADPLRRTRSSRKSAEFELAPQATVVAGAGAGAGPSAAAADHLLYTGFPGNTSSAPPPSASGAVSRRTSSRQHQQASLLQLPSFNDPFGDVLLTPTFTSAEITMLIEALTPAAGGKLH